MKKVFFSLLVVWCVSVGIQAQEFKPGKTGKGLVDLRNTSVDYSTGIFNYTVPLFEISSSRYKLPIALTYSARGVKVGEVGGPCGMGWNLLCGGVISLTVRGGIYDGESEGFLNRVLDHADETVKKVNSHDQDGEVDIYTAVFNGRQVSFFLMKENGQRVVKTLEKTNLQISSMERGWKITDEQGVVYVFNSVEETEGVCVGDSNNSGNTIFNKSYRSSWHLSEIDVPGEEPIYFEYSEPFLIDYTSNDQIVYYYGKAIKERAYDMKSYKSRIDENMMNAQLLAAELAALGPYWRVLEDVREIPRLIEKVVNISATVEEDGLHFNVETLPIPVSGLIINYNYIFQSMLNDRVMGIMSDLGYNAEICSATMAKLTEVIEILKNTSGGEITANALRGCLSNVVSDIQRALDNTESKSVKCVGDLSRYSVRERRLKRVRWGVHEVNFTGDNYQIAGIQWQNQKADIVKDVRFGYAGGYLKRLVFGEKVNEKVEAYDFAYHLDTLNARGSDVWGFYNGDRMRARNRIPDMGQIYYDYAFMCGPVITAWPGADIEELSDRAIHEKYTPAFSLKQITHSNGWRLFVDYESNKYDGSLFGGIRLKRLIEDDGNGVRDTIVYHYRDLSRPDGMESGKLAVGYQTLVKELDYGDFKDKLLLSSVLDDEMVIGNRGNNGIFYDYVLEEFVGRGYQAHYFLVPSSFRELVKQRTFYPYWLYGLPLGTALYDHRGRLMKLSKCQYSAALVDGVEGSDYHFEPVVVSNYFTGTSLFPFSSFVEQLKPYRFYMNREETLSAMPNEDIPFYWNGTGYGYYNPYKDFYVPNMQPRENMRVPNQYYKMYYGGCPVVMGSTEYEFFDIETGNGGIPGKDVFTRTAFDGKYGVTTVTHLFENPERVIPTSTVTRGNDGTEYKQMARVIMDNFSDGGQGSVLDSMRVAHMVYSPVKTTELVKAAGTSNFLLTGEQVVTYTGVQVEGKNRYFPETSRVLLLENAMNMPTGGEGRTFTMPESSYFVNGRWGYVQENKRVQVAENESVDGREVYLYDPETGNQIVSARNVKRTAIAALDKYRVAELQYLNLGTSSLDFSLKGLSDFWEFHQNFTNDEFLESDLHRKIMTVVKAFLDRKECDLIILTRNTREDYIINQYELAWGRSKTLMRISLEDYQKMVFDVVDYLTLKMKNPAGLFYLLNRDVLGVNLRNNLTVKEAVGNKYFYEVLVERYPSAEHAISASWTIRYAGGNVVTGSQTLVAPAGNGLYCLRGEIDLAPSAGGVKLPEIELGFGFGPIPLSAVLYPQGTMFELRTLDGKGQVVCRTDANGIVERVEYDNAGRVFQVIDRNGSVVKEYHYHTVVAN